MKRRKIGTMVAAAALLVALGWAGASLSLAEKQPNMRQALHKLQAAKALLERATPDKDGHRVKAIELVTQAITEVRAGIQSDNAKP